MKIIQIDGFKGLVTAAFIVICLGAGFIAFPGLVAMHLWNKYLVTLFSFPVINLFQGILLWGMAATIFMIVFDNKLPVKFVEPKSLSDPELDMIMKKARIHSRINEIEKVISEKDSFEKTMTNMDNNVPPTIQINNETEEDKNYISNINNHKE